MRWRKPEAAMIAAISRLTAISLRRDVGKPRRRCLTIDPLCSRAIRSCPTFSMTPACRHIQHESAGKRGDRRFGGCYHGSHSAIENEAQTSLEGGYAVASKEA